MPDRDGEQHRETRQHERDPGGAEQRGKIRAHRAHARGRAHRARAIRVREHAREILRLAVVPHVPRAEALLERAVAHARAQDLVHRVAKHAVGAREHRHVVPRRHRNRLDVKPARAPQRALGDDVVEEHGFHAPRHEILVRMHIVVVRDRDRAVVRLQVEQRLIRARAAERGDALAGEIAQRAIARAVGEANGEHLAELEVRDRHRVPRAQLGPILDARHADREVAALHRRLDRRPRHLHEHRRAMQVVSDHRRDLDIEAAHLRWISGVGLDEGRAALRVTAPAQRRVLGPARAHEPLASTRSSAASGR